MTVEQWKNVLWSDESKFEIFFSKRRQYVRRFGDQTKDVCLKITFKDGRRSFMVWECLTANGVGYLVRIDGIMIMEKYKQILVYHTIPSVKHLIGNSLFFLQDKDPKQTALKVKVIWSRRNILDIFKLWKSLLKVQICISSRLFESKKGWKTIKIKNAFLASPPRCLE